MMKYLLFSSLIAHGLSQVTEPIVPDSIVVEHAEQVLADASISGCARACAIIAKAIPSDCYLKKEGAFAMWDAKQSDLTPACRVEPATPEDVAIILKAAIADSCHFAVRSGGHSRIAGSSNAEDGITIDLRKLNEVEISEDKKTAKFGAGNTWGRVYKTLEKDDYVVVGGRVSDVGVGGLILGGGISFLSNRYGWAADSITAYEMVLPDASIKTVTHKSDPDLFWALRGGGNNFGIVTAFHSKLIKRKPSMWRGSRMFAMDKIAELTDALYKFGTERQAKDADAVGWVPYCYVPAYDLTAALPTLFHGAHTDDQTWPKAFADFEKLEGLPNTTEIVVQPQSGMTDDIEKVSPPGQRTIYKTITYRSDPALDAQIIGIFLEEVEAVKKVEGVLPCAIFHPTGPGHTKPMSDNGGNPLGIAGERPLTIMMSSWTWQNKEDDELNEKTLLRFFERSTKAAKDAGRLMPFIYQNYAHSDQDVFKGYGPANQRRLQSIQKKIDPNGVFAGGEGLSRGYFKVNTKKSEGASATGGARDEL